MKRTKVFLSFVMILCFGMTAVAALFAGDLKISFKSVPKIDDSFEFLQLRTKLQESRKPAEKNNVHFAIAEYYLKVNDLHDAQAALAQHINSEVVDITTLLANVYLYKIANYRHDQAQVDRLKKEIFDNKFVLLFEKFKQINYTSLLGNTYEVRHFVDRIEVFLNGDVLETFGS